jgi:putative membrane protein
MKQRFSLLTAQFKWRTLLVRWLVHALVLLGVALLVPQIYFTDRRVWVWLMVSAGFGLLNSVVRPIIQALVLQLFFVSLGLVLALVNAFILYLVSWIFPNRFAVDSFLWALVGGLLVVFLGTFLEGLFGLTRPIVPESDAELRRRLKAQDRSLVYTFVKPHPAPLASEDAVSFVAALPSGAAPQHEGLPLPAEADRPPAPPDEVEPPALPPEAVRPGLAKRTRRAVSGRTARRTAAEPGAPEQAAAPELMAPDAAPVEAEPAPVSEQTDAAAGVPARGEEAAL